MLALFIRAISLTAFLSHNYQATLADRYITHTFVDHIYNLCLLIEDVLGVFAVHVTMREDNAMNVVDLSEAQLKDLRTVFWDMNQITVERETEDGETTT